MDIRQITPRFFAAPQISPDDMQEIVAAGITRVVCNRPDTEVPPSHRADVMAKAARQAGLDFEVLPLTHQSMTPEVIAKNHQLLNDDEGPVLAYCASGTRSTIAWALGAATHMPIEDIVQAAAVGGYDLANLVPALQGAADR